MFIKKGGLNLKNAGRELPLLLASGIAMGINWILLFQAYRYTTIFGGYFKLLLCAGYCYGGFAAFVS